MKEETAKQFIQFLTVRNRDYRAVNVEITATKSEIKHIKWFPYHDSMPRSDKWLKEHNMFERLERLEERLDELFDMVHDKKQLAKQFAPRFYTIVDGNRYYIKTRKQASAMIDEACGYDVDGGDGGKPLWKLCTHCEEEKALSEFYKHNSTKDKRCTQCKDCNAITVSNNRANKKRREQERQEYTECINTV